LEVDVRRLSRCATADDATEGADSVNGETVELERKRRTLARRLEDGYARIDQAIAQGADVAAWETFWIDLLREYESVCDELRGIGEEVRV
jgi:hypothetical protein